MFSGCYTALVTPFRKDGGVDWLGLERLIEFQIAQGVNGILAVGTTGESSTLTWTEHEDITKFVCGITDKYFRPGAAKHCSVIAGTGSNSTRETLLATEHAVKCGASAVLLVDPYYNGPSSLEIRREYVAPIARVFPDLPIIPYVIPGRTGTQLLPEDIAILHQEYCNVCAVKEATGDFANMARTRLLCGDDFDILSGDDDKTAAIILGADIGASGVISVVSNVAPAAVQEFTDEMHKHGEIPVRLAGALQPLFNIVTVKTREQTKYGPVICRARNPLPIKTLMNILGMPAGSCRQPLGKMTAEGFQVVLSAARAVHEQNPEIFAPIEDFFHVDIAKRLQDGESWRGLYYDSYIGD